MLIQLDRDDVCSCKDSELEFQSMGLNRIWIIVIFALAVGGCSRFKLLYSFSGEAIESEVGYFLDLNEDEQTVLEAKFVDLFD
ncbi:MAG: hypothetical protein VYB59_03425, partial [Pseudomonadota bacterium]|nr:hypothetical protein [Pseudomonadota bacterium]